jgi:hypothetical protein
MVPISVVALAAFSGWDPAAASSPAEAAIQELGFIVPGHIFSGDVPKAYLPDAGDAGAIRENPARYPLRTAVMEAVAALQPARQMQSNLLQADNEPEALRRKRVRTAQEAAATSILELDLIQTSLEKAAESRDKEPSQRWQAHLDFVTAEVAFQLARAHEFDLVAGQAVPLELPAFTPKSGFNGWRMVPTAKMRSKRDVLVQAEGAISGMRAVQEKHPGTPWAALAANFADRPLGLEWIPAKVPAYNLPVRKKP